MKVTNKGNSWDTRPETRFESQDSSVSGWLELAAALITLGAATLGAFTAFQKFTGEYWLLTLTVCIAVALIAGFFAIHFTAARLEGHSVVRVSDWVLGVLLKRDSRRLVWTRPKADCMYCPATRKSLMTLYWRGGEAQWVCKLNKRQHVSALDWTQI
ncbi:hypothetical protein [Microbacterium sp. KRD174]